MKKILTLLLSMVLVISSLTISTQASESSTYISGEEIVEYASQFLGCPYVYGGKGPYAFDCSGFVSYVLNHFGLASSVTAGDYYNNPTAYGTVISADEALPGDLCSWPGHVGIYIGNGYLINALNYQYGVCNFLVAWTYYYQEPIYIRPYGVNYTATVPDSGVGDNSGIVSGDDEEQETLRFNDLDSSNVPSGVQTAINWAADNGIVSGYDDGTFNPLGECTRLQLAIMLWRFTGKEEPKSLDSALVFSDIAELSEQGLLSEGAKKAIAWAVEYGLISGYTESDGTKTFRPYDNISRASTVVMLWRLAGKPGSDAESEDFMLCFCDSSFDDVTECSNGVKKAIAWAAYLGITKGSSQEDGTTVFNPSELCLRMHMATFIYRFSNTVFSY